MSPWKYFVILAVTFTGAAEVSINSSFGEEKDAGSAYLADAVRLFQVKIPSLEQTQLSHQELGSLVHACLEKGDYDGLKEIELKVGAARFVAEPVISWALSSDWMVPTRGQGDREVWTELAFEIPIAGQILVGAMDRIVADSQKNIFSIIDFKITEKPKSVSALTEAYQAQIELYGFALTVLEPGLTLQNIQALLVNISRGHIQTVPIGLGKLNLLQLAELSSEIVNGKNGVPRPGALCRMCEFRMSCKEGSDSLSFLSKD
jgi:hypothetical protein